MATAETLIELLAGSQIRLKSLASGHTEHLVCPRCGGGTSKEKSLSVTVDRDGEGATWVCHRGSCGWQDGGRIHRASPAPRRDVGYVRPPEHPQAQTANRPDWLYEAFAERKIGARALHELGIYGIERNFPHPFGRLRTIVFPYRFQGEVTNRKYRGHPEKRAMQQEKDALPTLFNVDALGEDPAEIVWVEGEMDVAALVECGIRNAVTLKDGAPAFARAETDPNAKRFEALRTHAEMLDKVSRIVLAGDMDVPGLALREELARRLGRHRCLLVTWPDGCKDAGDVLRLHGPDAVTAALARAVPYPIDGVQRIGPEALLALRQLPAPRTMTTGTAATDRIVKLPTEGRLVIVTGFPGGGKTTWVRFVMVHTAANCSRRWAVFSPEMQPWEQFAAECAEVLTGKPFWPTPGIESMSEDDTRLAGEWLSDKVTMLVCDAEDAAPTVEWILERARATVLRDGVTDLVIDPWNEVDQQRGPITETEFIGRSLQRLKAFGLRHGCNVWVIVHPAKPIQIKPGEVRPAPGPYDLAGSAHWANKADLGLTLHSPKAGSAELHLWKSRFRRFGTKNAVTTVDFNALIGTYSTPLAQLADAPPSSWQDIDR